MPPVFRPCPALLDDRASLLGPSQSLRGETEGRPAQRAGSADHLSAGCTETTALQIILAPAVKALSNYSNHLFQTVVDDKLAAYKVA